MNCPILKCSLIALHVCGCVSVLEPRRLFGRDLPLVISITAKAGTGSSGIYFKEHD
jgi:hypothetical protein